MDAALLDEGDRYVAEHPTTTRSTVIDAALHLWSARERERAIEAQYEEPSATDPEELAAWRAIQRASTERLFRPR